MSNELAAEMEGWQCVLSEVPAWLTYTNEWKQQMKVTTYLNMLNRWTDSISVPCKLQTAVGDKTKNRLLHECIT